MFFKDSEENKNVSYPTSRKKKKSRAVMIAWDGAKSYEFRFMWYHMLMIITVNISLGHKGSAAIHCNRRYVYDIIGHSKAYLNNGGSIRK